MELLAIPATPFVLFVVGIIVFVIARLLTWVTGQPMIHPDPDFDLVLGGPGRAIDHKNGGGWKGDLSYILREGRVVKIVRFNKETKEYDLVECLPGYEHIGFTYEPDELRIQTPGERSSDSAE